MNLIEESVRDREQKKGKKATRIVLIFIILLVMAIIGISVYLVYVQSTTLRVVLDGQVNEKLKSILFFEEDGTIYAPIVMMVAMKKNHKRKANVMFKMKVKLQILY